MERGTIPNISTGEKYAFVRKYSLRVSHSVRLLSLSGSETGVVEDNEVNTMGADALASFIAMSSVSIALKMSEKRPLSSEKN